MRRNTRLIGVFSGVVLLVFLFVAVKGVAEKPSALPKLPEIPAGEYDPAYWGEFYPLQYKSYLKNVESHPPLSGYGGSIPYQISTRQPEILINFKGMAFSEDYGEDRGHNYALHDLTRSKRIKPSSPGACMTCKSANLIDIYRDMGWSYAKKPMSEIVTRLAHSISCANCHDPSTMRLRITNPAFTEALERRGVDLEKVTRGEMRSYVCGQCHSEYYFEPGTTRVIFPWDRGLKPEETYAYYATSPGGFVRDWVHPDSGAKLLKAQHPDFETWSTGTHGSAGVSCADCHMPYMKDGKTRYSSHWVTSPMRSVEDSCMPCHAQSEEWLRGRVKVIQDSTWLMQRTAGRLVARAHETIGKAVSGGKVDRSEIDEARELVRKAQWYWDFVAAENSMGFHNPVQTLSTLGRSIDMSYQAIEKANRAVVAKP